MHVEDVQQARQAVLGIELERFDKKDAYHKILLLSTFDPDV